jgi:cyclopropane fatty-acyl-phospholipid synthase-like methyltransferase
MRKYYEAYDERYKAVHKKNLRWLGYAPSDIVFEIIKKYGISADDTVLEIGCGEGRDSIYLLENGYNLLATDVSPEAVNYCKSQYKDFADRFDLLDAVKGKLDKKFDYIYSVAVLHMLVEDEDRQAFYAFIKEHLTENGIALICTMGDGEMERKTDVSVAFDLGERVCEGETVLVAETSCRIVTAQTFEKELKDADLEIIEQGLTSVENHFPVMMYGIVKITKQ